MKKSLAIILLSLASLHCVAQKFPMDTTGMINYKEIISVDSLQKRIGFRNALHYLRLKKNEIVDVSSIDSVNGIIAGNSSFTVYSQSGVFKKLSGTISYSFSLEVKDGKYRYSFSHFLFHYYQQDRTYKMVATGKTKKMEETDAPGWQKLWMSHKAFAHEEMSQNIETLKSVMKERPIVDKKSPRKKIEW